MNRAGLIRVVAAFVLVGCSNPEHPRTASSEQPPAAGAAVGSGGAGATLKGDAEFVTDVAGKNEAAIELSRLALDKAASPQVKAFAQMMIRDHGTAGDKLKSTLSDDTIEWPVRLDDKQRQTADDLLRRQSSDFDLDYLKAMIELQQNLTATLESRLDVTALAEWKTAAAGRTDRQAMPEPRADMADVLPRPNKSDNATTMKVNQWAADTYPVAQKGLDTARALENSIKTRSAG
jgi:putative membrane protein